MLATNSKIELLAPARNYETAVAAVDYGADALYMGAPRFGARHAAGNSIDDIARTVTYARPYGVRVYATLNTLLFENELQEARRTALELISAGVDALIVQDMAYMEMGLTGVEFHASTQTFNASPEKVAFLEKAGFSRVILERALTLEQIKAIRAATGVELECFVHGAICVGHSGRCWLSRSMGPRSGNRGECSQPCRLTYDLMDDSGRTLMRNKHLLSVQDLDLSERIGDLLDAGITSFKIEGRLKDVAYVKNTVSFYRQRLDAEMAIRNSLRGFNSGIAVGDRGEGLALGPTADNNLCVSGGDETINDNFRKPHTKTSPRFVRASSGESLHDFTPDLDKTFTRGRSEYFFFGPRRGVSSFDTPKALGSYLGTVARSGRGWFELDRNADAAAGDGVCFFVGDTLAGTNINKMEGRRIFPNREYALAPGTAVYRNYDHAFAQSLERSRTRRVIDVRAEAGVGPGGVWLSLVDADGVAVRVKSEGPFESAKDPAAMIATLRAQIARSGDTIFRITDVEVVGEETALSVPFISVSVVNSLRREGLKQLMEARVKRPAVRNIPQPEETYPYPARSVDGSENITNSLSERFYRRHGVVEIAPGLDLHDDFVGRQVMRTPYCIKREMGECLRKGSGGNKKTIAREGHTLREGGTVHKSQTLRHGRTPARNDLTPARNDRELARDVWTSVGDDRKPVCDARPSARGPLILVHGAHCYRLEFDCAECMMNVICES